MKKLHISCPLETEISNALTSNGIHFIHESQNNKSRLDFYLPEYDLYLEVKSGHSERTDSQLASQHNVILIQGMKSTKFICDLILKK